MANPGGGQDRLKSNQPPLFLVQTRPGTAQEPFPSLTNPVNSCTRERPLDLFPICVSELYVSKPFSLQFIHNAAAKALIKSHPSSNPFTGFLTLQHQVQIPHSQLHVSSTPCGPLCSLCFAGTFSSLLKSGYVKAE